MSTIRKLKINIEVPVTTVKQAISITGGLSNPSKMPGRAWGISPDLCKRGSVLSKIEGSTCSNCYAKKGFYPLPSVVNAHNNRITRHEHPQWVEAMVFLIDRYSGGYFRWFDAGDLQSAGMLAKIYKVCEALPKVKHWLATRELGILRASRLSKPSNLVIRASASMVDGKPPAGFATTSTVASRPHKVRWSGLVQHNADDRHFCPASLQDNNCGECRACWSGEVKDVCYLEH